MGLDERLMAGKAAPALDWHRLPRTLLLEHVLVWLFRTYALSAG